MSINNKRFALFLAWIISISAVIITLYSSEIANTPVCHMCWYQRIMLYPLAIILGIAIFRDDLKIYIYALPLTLIGAAFALYQYLEQMFPKLAPISLCSTGPSCSDIHLKIFGFITFPLLSLIAALTIAALLLLAKPKT
jgi:disulfide bond formation protein DsbB